jgi:replicative DNA helicase
MSSDLAKQALGNIIGALVCRPEDLADILKQCEELLPCMLEDIPRAILGAYREEYEKGKALDGLTLTAKLAPVVSEDILSDYLKACICVLPFTYNYKAWADIIASEYRKQKLSEVADVAARALEAHSVDVAIGVVADYVESLAASEQDALCSTMGDLTQVLKDTCFVERPPYIGTGLKEIDKMAIIDKGGDLTIVGARTSAGKTAFALGIALHQARNKKRVGVFSLEMSSTQIGKRLISMISKIPLDRIERGIAFVGDEKERFYSAIDELNSLENYLFIWSGAWTVKRIARKARNMQLDLLCVDYLQLVVPDSKNSSRYVEVDGISRELKQLAMTMDIPVIALSQLNRMSEGRADKRPTMAEMREAGGIEMDASIVMLLYANDEEDRTKRVLEIAKNRQGQCGAVALKFDGATMTFTETGEPVETGKRRKPIVTPFD